MFSRKPSLDDAHVFAKERYSGYLLFGEDLYTHMTHVTNLFHHYWPLADDEHVAAVLLCYLPECSTGLEALGASFTRRFGGDTIAYLWEVHRAIGFTHAPLRMYALRTHIGKLSKHDVWTLRALAAYTVVTVKLSHHLRAVSDAILAAAAEDIDLRHLLASHTLPRNV